MSGIKDYSSTPASNTALFPEGQTPSSLNDGMRQVQGDVRSWYEDAAWTDLGYTPTRTGNTTFTVSGDKTTDFTAGRRIKCTDSSTLYGTITSSSYSSPNTTVTVDLDSGTLSASLTNVALSINKPTNVAMHANLGRKGTTIASASTVDLSTATGDFVDVSGTTTITALGTVASGVLRTIRFTGALILTHNSTSLILPSAASITTANGDVATFRSLGSGNWQCTSYMKADGSSLALATNGITYAKIQQAAAHTLLANTTGSTANIAEVATSNFVQNVVVQTFTASGTYTPTTGMVKCLVEIVGGGGAGGGGASGTGTAAGGGGGAGGYSRKLFTAATIGASQTVTIGAAGAAGAAGNTAGGNGGNSTFGALLTANGGTGGGGSAVATSATQGGGSGAGGSATGGDINITGGQGGIGIILTSNGIGAAGGTSVLGAGGAQTYPYAAGNPGTNYGAGGSGGVSTTPTARAGGAGTAGICIVTEFIAV